MCSLCVVICNYNKQDYVLNAIASIKRTAWGLADILVVDNASTDDSVTLIKQQYPDIRLICEQENLGGAGGFALGMQFAFDAGYEYIALLDNDAIVAEGTLAGMQALLQERNDIGVVGPAICKLDQPDQIQEIGGKISISEANFYLNARDQLYSSVEKTLLPCDYVPACCLMTRREVIARVGVFDTAYFLYWDDIDWCCRIREAGWSVMAAPAYVAWHKGGGLGSPDQLVRYYQWRNRIRFFVKNLTMFDRAVVRQALSEKVAQYVTVQCLYGQPPVQLLQALSDLETGALGKYTGPNLGTLNIDKLSQFKAAFPPGHYRLEWTTALLNSAAAPQRFAFLQSCRWLINEGYVFFLDKTLWSGLAVAELPENVLCAEEQRDPALIVHSHLLDRSGSENPVRCTDLFWNSLPSEVPGEQALDIGKQVYLTISCLNRLMDLPQSE